MVRPVNAIFHDGAHTNLFFEFGLIVIPQPGSRSRSKTNQDMSGLSDFTARFERFEQFGRFFGQTARNRSNLARFLSGFF